ncbi:PIN domain-containing protein [Bradyrhizobium sp.]|uniref:type II toxin-antitoxin system VapC family toxin n=1 Tax=Bradyrhizobium sp. TaxID=376 RepID=UPI001D9031A3|nr:PIN domain-containing protein [Bradyrhizobium sp.]MBI5321471.1 PIN domain-containing protein [Bradyrhizobium sp.]
MTDSRVYLDANVFIYAIEGSPEVAGPLQRLFELFRTKRGVGVTSELTLAEVLPRATTVQRRLYLDLLIWSRTFDLQPISREVLVETADYRRNAQMPKLPDAIHVVTAIRTGCRTVISADSRLKLPEGFRSLLPDPASVFRIVQDLS